MSCGAEALYISINVVPVSTGCILAIHHKNALYSQHGDTKNDKVQQKRIRLRTEKHPLESIMSFRSMYFSFNIEFTSETHTVGVNELSDLKHIMTINGRKKINRRSTRQIWNCRWNLILLCFSRNSYCLLRNELSS